MKPSPRVGYAGGTTSAPTYYAIGDHSETIQVDYDPAMISYDELLAVFLEAHSPSAPAYSQQYASLIHYHDKAQRTAAVAAIAAFEGRTGRAAATQIVPFTAFYLAEDYHQKYQLSRWPAVRAELEALYPDERAFAASTAAMRLNAYAGGYLPADGLAAEATSLGLSSTAAEALSRMIGR